MPDDPAYDFGQGAGFYVDATQEPFAKNYRMFSYIMDELPKLIEETFPVDPERQSITGHSMGGHGALTLALRNPGRYRSISAFAPIVAPSQVPWGEKALGRYLGPDRAAWRAHDAVALIEDGARVPEILVDQGTSDNFLQQELKTGAARSRVSRRRHRAHPADAGGLRSQLLFHLHLYGGSSALALGAADGMTSSLLRPMIDAALAAGAEIERLYIEGCEAEEKLDGSPVTIADRHAELIILERLAAAFPDIPVLAEEEACAGRIPEIGTRFFCVDPLDGTKGFVGRTGEFTVNIALVEQGEPVAGVIYAPDPKSLFYGARGEGAFRRTGQGEDEPIRVRPCPASGLIGVGSRSHHAAGTEAKNARLGIADYLPSGSSLKFCRLAEGAADVYPRYGRTMEWDTAAGQAILEAAGGRVMALGPDGEEAGPLGYGKSEGGFENPNFIAWGGAPALK